ncbi:Uncharacterized protein APZ42_029269 [Daphnia magna]|uniref:Uncharacterized protein n=1 Tax=Daphnia magna TaxID=35525 RepID=A0A164PSI9_9CRUS|nr:Uncharacterized protein APZ42_029269 [Daphnia magna]
MLENKQQQNNTVTRLLRRATIVMVLFLCAIKGRDRHVCCFCPFLWACHNVWAHSVTHLSDKQIKTERRCKSAPCSKPKLLKRFPSS